MSSKELKRWAKTTDFAGPINWGEVEARIMAEPAPTAEEVARVAQHAPARGAKGVLLMLFRWLALAPFVVPTFGASVVGLAFVVAFVVFGKELPADWGIVVQLVFGGGLLITFFTVYTWLESRRRGWENLGVSGLTALASGGSSLLLATSTTTLTDVWPSVALMANITAVAALLAFLFFLVFAKPTPALSAQERRRELPPEEQWLRGQRAAVLHQLVQRGLVNDADMSNMIIMPPGTWLQLESLPDGRVIRHL
ncbi:MAG: hypothetical protein H0X12_03160 [Nocardioides sp.]|nr:hypothetical protein [Nocardioides sp.]